MAFKSLLLSTTLLVTFISTDAHAIFGFNKKNRCDDLDEALEMRKGDMSEKEIEKEERNITKCRASEGESSYYKKKQAKLAKEAKKEQKRKEKEAKEDQKEREKEAKSNKWKNSDDHEVTIEDATLKANIETKVFSKDDLKEAGYGKPFFAKKIFLNMKDPEVLTTGDALCQHLGYTKATKSMISAQELEPEQAYMNGWVVEIGGWFSKKVKKPELYDNKKIDYKIKPYVGVTCIRLKEDHEKGTEKALKKVVEYVIEVNSIDQEDDGVASVNDGARKPAEKKVDLPPTQFGFVPEKKAPAAETAPK